MAEKKTIIINGNPVEAWQFSHSAQEIDDAVDAAVTQEERDSWNGKLDRTGGRITGDLLFGGAASYGEFKVLGLDGKGVTVSNDQIGDCNGYKDGKPILSYNGTECDENVILRGIDTPVLEGDAANKKYVDEQVSAVSGIPAGCIVMWSGAVSNIPDGWHLCDGTNGTPDLRDRFVVGAGNAYTPGATGGNAQVTLTKEQLPEHTHTYNKSSGKKSSYGMSNGGKEITEFGSSTYTDSGSTGSGQAVDILPPYYALCYIMRIS